MITTDCLLPAGDDQLEKELLGDCPIKIGIVVFLCLSRESDEKPRDSFDGCGCKVLR